MPSTYSPLLRLELIGAGEQSGLWGDTTNKNIGQLLEQAIAGVTTVALSGGAGDYTLSALDGTFDESRSAVLKFTGSPSGTKNIIIPTETKLYVVRNDCGQIITLKTSTQVTGVTVLNGEATLVFCDGTNAVAGIATAGVGPTTVANGGTGATSFTGGFVKSPGGTGTLTSATTVNAATELSGITGIANGGTGVIGFTAGSLVVGNGASPLATLAGSVSGQVATWNGSAWTASFPAAGGVTSVFGRTGIITALNGDYAAFYPSLSGAYSNPTWISSLAGTKITGTVADATNATNATNATSATNATFATTAGSATNASNASNADALGGVGAASYARRDIANSYSGVNTFVSGGLYSPTHNFTSITSIFNTGNSDMQFAVNAATRMKIDANGDLTITGNTATKNSGTAWANPSDRRLKTNIINYTKGLTELTQIVPKTFEFNGKGGSTAGLKTVGIIADEIEQVLPDTVQTRLSKLNPTDTVDTEIKYFDSSELTWVMINAIKELKAEVDTLKIQLAAK